MKILLVEDHPALAATSSGLLRDIYDHEVEVAATGAEAMAKLPAFRPHLVLLDINLPDINGYQLARQIRTCADYDATVLVALTGFGNIIDDPTAHRAGFDAQFRKPLDFAVLPTLRRLPNTANLPQAPRERR